MQASSANTPHAADRAADDGRGRRATAPTAIPLAGWKDILLRVFRAFGDNNLSLVGAGMSFFGLLALFPAIAAFVALYGLIQDPQAVVDQLGGLREVLPAEVAATLIGQMRAVAAAGEAKLTVAAGISLLIALWSARTGTNALINALNIVYGEPNRRGLVWGTAFSLLLTVAIILGVIAVALVAVGVPLVFAWFGLDGWLLVVGRALGIALAAALLVFGLAGLYRWAPSRRPPQWRWVAAGALFVAVFWVLGSLLFSLYTAAAGQYSATYGSLGAVVILLTWLYLTALILLLGGELNAHLELQTGKDTTSHGRREPGPRELGQRGAFMADHVAPLQDK